MIENNPFTFSEFEKADLDDPAVLNVRILSSLET